MLVHILFNFVVVHVLHLLVFYFVLATEIMGHCLGVVVFKNFDFLKSFSVNLDFQHHFWVFRRFAIIHNLHMVFDDFKNPMLFVRIIYLILPAKLMRQVIWLVTLVYIEVFDTTFL